MARRTLSNPALLETYRRKRDFARTSEPSGRGAGAARKSFFVIQKHAATRLHYDFRLEVGGVLKSWAVPKGPSMDPAQKRLAVPTEDHPIDYAEFEGTISKGEYGGGTVMVWDIGPFESLKTEPMEESLARGRAEFRLKGKKLRGGFALVRMQRADRAWLLIKLRDDKADPEHEPVTEKPDSVLTGRSLEEIASGARGKRSR